MINGIPGVTHALVPHWRGDLLLVLSGLGYASYSLIGREVLLRRDALDVTARSIIWGGLAMAPLALLEWQGGARPVLTVCGHIHQSWGQEATIGPTRVVNVGPQGMFFDV